MDIRRNIGFICSACEHNNLRQQMTLDLSYFVRRNPQVYLAEDLSVICFIKSYINSVNGDRGPFRDLFYKVFMPVKEKEFSER